ncbi:MAG: hypothetical protein AUI84_05185 [Delftia sp. 13_1_40CM_3_66_6]|nr:hypothetical protein [Delftia sp.]OLE08603.1 MAG: hypothetical protein AUG53_05375 [Delftia sp. 13_1_20CM_4_67_18]OLE95219.1 MAG: hypothetical protein AUI84_05185 [Delftia sp. 13_1_40CM_3_66_6]HBY34722.1 hypothetical protein [Delftia acidovorans]
MRQLADITQAAWGLGARCVRCRPTDGASLSRDARRLARPGGKERKWSAVTQMSIKPVKLV